MAPEISVYLVYYFCFEHCTGDQTLNKCMLEGCFISKDYSASFEGLLACIYGWPSSKCGSSTLPFSSYKVTNVIKGPTSTTLSNPSYLPKARFALLSYLLHSHIFPWYQISCPVLVFSLPVLFCFVFFLFSPWIILPGLLISPVRYRCEAHRLGFGLGTYWCACTCVHVYIWVSTCLPCSSRERNQCSTSSALIRELSNFSFLLRNFSLTEAWHLLSSLDWLASHPRDPFLPLCCWE